MQVISESLKGEYKTLELSLETKKKEVLQEINSIIHTTFNSRHDTTSFDRMGVVGEEGFGGRSIIKPRRTLRRVSRTRTRTRRRRRAIKKNITRKFPVRRFYPRNNNKTARLRIRLD